MPRGAVWGTLYLMRVLFRKRVSSHKYFVNAIHQMQWRFFCFVFFQTCKKMSSCSDCKIRPQWQTSYYLTCKSNYWHITSINSSVSSFCIFQIDLGSGDRPRCLSKMSFSCTEKPWVTEMPNIYLQPPSLLIVFPGSLITEIMIWLHFWWVNDKLISAPSVLVQLKNFIRLLSGSYAMQSAEACLSAKKSNYFCLTGSGSLSQGCCKLLQFSEYVTLYITFVPL